MCSRNTNKKKKVNVGKHCSNPQCFVRKTIMFFQHVLVVVNFYIGLYVIIQNIKRHEKNIVLYATTYTKINYYALLQWFVLFCFFFLFIFFNDTLIGPNWWPIKAYWLVKSKIQIKGTKLKREVKRGCCFKRGVKCSLWSINFSNYKLLVPQNLCNLVLAPNFIFLIFYPWFERGERK